MKRLVIVALLISGVLVYSAGSQELDRWIGQMLLVGFRGTEMTRSSPIWEPLQTGHLGGVILFDRDVPSGSPVRNILSAAQVRRLTGRLQKLSPIPLFIAIDQEGGRVARLNERHGFAATLSEAELGRLDQEAATRRQARQTARLLASLGINVNLAPVVDLARNPENPVIARLGRSYGSDPSLVARQARWMIEEHHRKGVLCALKHFPGHGSSRSDSHLGLPDVTGLWSVDELDPFAVLIDEGLADMVMTAHLFDADWDPQYPATLSRKVIEGMLRGRLQFRGVVISDDLQMGAIAHNYGLERAIELALRAGVDILTFANNTTYDPRIAARAFGIIRQLVEEGRIPAARIRESYERIRRLKVRALGTH